MTMDFTADLPPPVACITVRLPCFRGLRNSPSPTMDRTAGAWLSKAGPERTGLRQIRLNRCNCGICRPNSAEVAHTRAVSWLVLAHATHVFESGRPTLKNLLRCAGVPEWWDAPGTHEVGSKCFIRLR